MKNSTRSGLAGTAAGVSTGAGSVRGVTDTPLDLALELAEVRPVAMRQVAEDRAGGLAVVDRLGHDGERRHLERLPADRDRAVGDPDRLVAQLRHLVDRLLTDLDQRGSLLPPLRDEVPGAPGESRVLADRPVHHVDGAVDVERGRYEQPERR